ncbi:cytochrome c oxidase subunit II [Knoellia sp. p5-6-4]|uniref:aa3-type cytochrome oxidase subunit II n=1 Tax=Knoellia sp. p5-6-4 TaxID=3032286 RepID=UPI0023DC5C08|nr:cytochrome c oxidase subunit II [Knoellia sp. p5-6-4]MDF2143663.1 cytochrome c oxidase subunit II [Knoellia sp. p5-6-4]
MPRPRGRRTWFTAATAGLSALALTGCAGRVEDGLLPRGATEGAERVTNLWVGSWIAALAVGVLVWGLILWCAVAYRRRRDDDGTLPVQLRYNVPLEILYTVVPVLMIAVLFFYTQRDESALLDTSKQPDVVVNAVGKQWSWDFNYVNEQVYETGTHAQLTGEPGVEETLPTLYLPVNKRVEFQLTARDVIHSFWIPAFLQKLDMIPGKVNRFQVVPTQTGTFQGKCAELCGAYHSQMLFNVKVVEQAEYDRHIAELKAKGNEGQLDNGLNREEIMDEDADKLENAGSN